MPDDLNIEATHLNKVNPSLKQYVKRIVQGECSASIGLSPVQFLDAVPETLFSAAP